MGKNKLPELLAPAGSIESLMAAVSAGADAVYLGGRKFGARNLASNFEGEELKKAVEYCHSRNVRVYVTHNILVHDNEIADSITELQFLFDIGVDAVLLQDFGILSAASKYLPFLELHASTQMTIHNQQGILWASENGISRVVLSREMNLAEVSAIKELTGTENTGIEVFIHGALCCSYSGQCLLSSMIGGRSGNRGLCAQPCRKEYDIVSLEYDELENPSRKKKKGSYYLMSPADLCTYRNLDSLIASGVDSLKIEGRMKSPEYVAIVVSVYRKALDMIAEGWWSPSGEDENLLLLAFNRNFTGGYISGESGFDIMSVDRPGNRGVYAGRIVRYDPAKKKVTVKAEGRIVPEAGDGVLIRQEGSGDDFGMSIPGNAEIKGPEISFHVKYPVVTGSSVYVTKSISLSKKAREISSSPGGVARKIPVHVKIGLDGKVPVASAVFPSLHGEQSFDMKGGFSMEKAKSRPVDPYSLRNIFCRTGNLQFEVEKYESDYPGGMFAPVSLLNEFRRDFFAGIEKRLIEVCRPSEEEISGAAENVNLFLSSLHTRGTAVRSGSVDQVVSVYVSTFSGAKAAFKVGCRRIYYEMKTAPGTNSDLYARELEEVISAAENYGAEFIWKWPRITDKSFFKTAAEILKSMGDKKPDGIMVENVGDSVAVNRIGGGIPLYGGQGLNIFNHLATGLFSEDYSLLTLSCELNRSQLKKLCGLAAGSLPARPLLEYSVYGPSEIFVSENNLPAVSLGKEYSASEDYGAADSTGRIFPVKVDGYGRTHIYNSAVTCLIDSLPQIFVAGIDTVSLDLRLYPPEAIEKITKLYMIAVELSRNGGKKSSQSLNSLKNEISSLYHGEITAGHFNRGV